MVFKAISHQIDERRRYNYGIITHENEGNEFSVAIASRKALRDVQRYAIVYGSWKVIRKGDVDEAEKTYAPVQGVVAVVGVLHFDTAMRGISVVLGLPKTRIFPLVAGFS